MALGTTHSILKSQTVLQQLLEEINFQRTKEMRQLQKDDSGFIVLQGTTYWTDLFVRHFLFQSEPDHSIDSDDLLFFVRKKHVKGTSRNMPKYETEVDVFRKDSRKLPIGDPDVDWEETVYLNLIIHQFNYTLTLAICTRTSPKELQVLRRHSQRVYASPSRRKMDTKGDGEEMTYPHICFMVDNFDEVFSDIMVRDGEMVCVELVASDRDGSVQGVIFLGSIRYDALKKVYDARQSSLSSKVAQRMTFGLFNSGGPQTRCEFVRMKGPQGKGHAEMAVTKPKGSGVETPTSEPGFCATDMWDEWEEDPDEYYNYRHQRRLSDPSANLNNYSRYGWKSKGTTSATGKCGGPGDISVGARARSENEGLDSLASELSEIEAGDLKDDRPASSATPKLSAVQKSASSDIKTSPSGGGGGTTLCCGHNCFGPKKRWSDSASGQMSEVYCRACDTQTKLVLKADNLDASGDSSASDADAAAAESLTADDLDSPACLANITPKRRAGGYTKPAANVLTIESELVIPSSGKSLLKIDKKSSSPLTSSSSKPKKASTPAKTPKKVAAVAKKVKPTPTVVDSLNGRNNNNNINNNINKKIEECEWADDATAFDANEPPTVTERSRKVGVLNAIESELMIRVQGTEELPARQQTTATKLPLQHVPSVVIDDNNKTMKAHTQVSSCCSSTTANTTTTSCNDSKISSNNTVVVDGNGQPLTADHQSNQCGDDHNGNDDDENNGGGHRLNRLNRNYSTLPKMKRIGGGQPLHAGHERPMKKIPMRTTPDGTNIYYWCDMSKRAIKELDDGAYNPLWATRGFTQTFHFWKEHRRQQSTPLNAFLTYVTLPWWSIAKDLLDHRETPILTF